MPYPPFYVGEDTPPEQPIGSTGALWFRPSTNKWYEKSGGSWAELKGNPVFETCVVEGATETDTLEVTGKAEVGELEVGGEAGITTTFEIAGVEMKFKGGVLYEVNN